MMRLRHLLLLLPLLFAANARAELWDITITGPAVYSGTQGTQTVVYRYDPADITFVHCGDSTPCVVDYNDPFWPAGPDFLHEYTYGVIQSVRWHGLVSGTGGPSWLRTSWDGENGEAQGAQFGGTIMNYHAPIFVGGCGTVVGMYACPYEVTRDVVGIEWETWGIMDGEDGWRWITSVTEGGAIVGRISFTRVLPEPSTLALLAAALGVVAIRGNRQHGIS